MIIQPFQPKPTNQPNNKPTNLPTYQPTNQPDLLSKSHLSTPFCIPLLYRLPMCLPSRSSTNHGPKSSARHWRLAEPHQTWSLEQFWRPQHVGIRPTSTSPPSLLRKRPRVTVKRLKKCLEKKQGFRLGPSIQQNNGASPEIQKIWPHE